jgi:hypothetical protein
MRKVYVFALGMGMTLLPHASVAAIGQSGTGAEGESGSDPAQMNEQARHQLDVALESNGLAGPGVKPWHLKVDFQMSLNSVDGPKSFSGSMEEWYAGPYRWLRTYKSERPSWNGSEWSVSKVERYKKKAQHADLEDYSLMSEIARPLIDPLFQLANIKPTDEVVVRKVDMGNVALNCVSLSGKSAAERGKWPEWLVPMTCFDDDSRLRMFRSEKTLIHFDGIQMFQGRAVARDVTVTFDGHQSAEITVTLLEAVESVDEALLKPPPDAVFRPYVIERGYPKPVTVSEVGAHLPSMPSGKPFTGTLLVPVFIEKDGTVKLERGVSKDDGPMGEVFKAVYKAVEKWRFQPYLVDGQPVEVDFDVPYETDGKPYVPSYERAPTPGYDVAGAHPGI